MDNKSFDYSLIRVGIDLGTTNSEIATSLNSDNSAEIVKNSRGNEYTPSVFVIDKGGNYHVGESAKRKFDGGDEGDAENGVKEIKRLMGTDEKRTFPRINKSLLPEEISAEILKSLKSDVLRKVPDANLFAAVITVPAYFEIPQNEATKRAGNLAGFEYVELLQEPIAAAIAYGCDQNNEDSNYLVFDFGGGTFDAAIISSRDKVLKVINHGGDNFLGGKDIDKALYDEVLIPAIKNKYKISTIPKDVKNYLSSVAEQCKIELTSAEEVNIEIDRIGNDDNGEEIYLNFNYNRSDFNQLIKPIIDKAINKAKEVIDNSGLSHNSISKVIFVGGPTQIPYLRERVENELGIPVDTSVDPLTTVARGACIYALSRQVPADVLMKNASGEKKDDLCRVTLNYQSTTPDDDELVTGSIDIPNENEEYYIQISADNGYYSSEKILVKNGKFFDTVSIKPNTTTRYWVYLIDSKGNNIPVFPDSFSITHGVSIQGMTIPYDIGVIYSKQGVSIESGYEEYCDRYFEKNSTLPLEATKTYKTIRDIETDSENHLPIKVYGGNYSTPKLNAIITELYIDGSKLPYKLPKGTEIDITIKINESRETTVEAYIPDIDVSIDARADLYIKDVDEEEIRSNIEAQKERVSEMDIDDDERKQLEDGLNEVENNIKSASDTDTKQKASRDLNEVIEKINHIEESQTSDILCEQLRKAFNATKELVEKISDEDGGKVKERLLGYIDVVEPQVDSAVESKDAIQIRQVLEQVEDIRAMALTENPGFWVHMYYMLKEKPIEEFSDSMRARQCILECQNAIDHNDLEGLKQNVRELLRMLPDDAQNDVANNMSGITK